MRELILLPAKKACVCNTDDPYGPRKNLYAGVDLRGGLYRTLMQFDTGVLINNCRPLSAMLKACAVLPNRDTAGNFTPRTITAGWDGETRWETQPEIDARFAGNAVEIDRGGWYAWDVSDAVQAWAQGRIENHGLMMCSKEEEPGLVCFETVLGGPDRSSFSPAIYVQYDGEHPAPEEGKRTISIFETLCAGGGTAHSEWRKTSCFKVYSFLVHNRGPEETYIRVQISPNRAVSIGEAAEFTVSPGETSAIVPQKYAFFARLAVRSAGEGGCRLKIWFQAQE